MTNGTLIFCPDGYKLVPVEATREMIADLLVGSLSAAKMQKAYSVALAAALPQPNGLDREGLAQAAYAAIQPSAAQDWSYALKMMREVGLVPKQFNRAYVIADAILAAAKGETP